MIIMIIVRRIKIAMAKIESHEALQIRHSDVLILMFYQCFIENNFIEFQVLEIFESNFRMGNFETREMTHLTFSSLVLSSYQNEVSFP